MPSSHTPAPQTGPLARWKPVLIVLFTVYAGVLAWHAYERINEVSLAARVRLIREHQLWELQPDFHGNPENWTQLAARLLNNSQLMARIKTKYGPVAEQIELDYRRDVAIAHAEVFVTAMFAFALPLCVPRGLVLLRQRRRPSAPPPKPRPASIDDPRYKPPPDND
jgi:hypothetical protein